MVASTLAIISLIFPPVSIVSSATVSLVTLRKGSTEGLIVLITSVAAAAVLAIVLQIGYQFALLYGLVLWLPVWVISIILREGRHLALAIEISVLIGAFGVIGFYAFYDNPVLLWQSILVQMVQPMLASAPDMPIDNLRQTLEVFSHYMTGVIAAGTVYGLLFGLFLGRYWQSVLFNPGGFKQEYLSLATHFWLAVVCIFVLIVAFLAPGIASEVAWNVTILFFVLYTFIGVAVLHKLLAGLKNSRIWVPLLYVTLLMIPHAMLPVSVLGLSDTWLNLRHKFSN